MEFYARPADERRKMALQWWASYPVNQVPRPVVLLNHRTSGGGFETGQAKVAFLSGAIDVAVDLPAKIIEALPQKNSRFQGTSIAVTAATADEGDFETDRGMQRLPAWRLTITGMLTDYLVLDPKYQGWWPAGVDGERLRQAGASHGHLAADDVTVQLGAPLICAEDRPTLEFVETETAVLYERTPPDPGSQPKTNLALWTTRLSATLPSPLGNRVLIDDRGVPTVLNPTR